MLRPALRILFIIAIGIAWLDSGLVHPATYYSYIDDHGNPVYTDAPETIPEKYRAKVKTHEQRDPTKPSALESVRSEIKDQAHHLNEKLHLNGKLPSMQGPWNGLSQEQSDILTYSGAAAIVLLLVMYLSKSQLIRLLGLCLLIALGIGAPVLMYVSDGGPMDILKQKAAAASQAQQNRADPLAR